MRAQVFDIWLWEYTSCTACFIIHAIYYSHTFFTQGNSTYCAIELIACVENMYYKLQCLLSEFVIVLFNCMIYTITMLTIAISLFNRYSSQSTVFMSLVCTPSTRSHFLKESDGCPFWQRVPTMIYQPEKRLNIFVFFLFSFYCAPRTHNYF